MKQRNRHIIQAAAALLSNLHLPGFITGRIYRGPMKQACVPGLNCYSCPGAVGSCPIGSLQAILGRRTQSISYYIVGVILLFGVLLGRLICGFLCPFGWIQDLLYKIPSPKYKIPARADKIMRKIKYVVLAAVILFPIFLVDPYGIGAPAFCKYLCPVGTLEGGIPLLIQNESLRSAVGWLFSWKLAILVVILTASILTYRPFCKYLCPLGAIYGLLNRWSLCQMTVNQQACTHCGACAAICKMDVQPTTKINSAECIRCGACKSVCPAHAIEYRFGLLAQSTHPREGCDSKI